MIIDDPEDPYADDYDEEYVLTISDWYALHRPSHAAKRFSHFLGSTSSL
ncbi:hypothetical protein IMZ48_36655 [Candidatus Bathyarchaeota archaeon]|nr:hypothetical protein [Candidatus Bathyarchaeota archaeon]